MIDLIILDKNLLPIGLIDNFISLIWAKRYNTVGDCELKLAATADNIDLLKRDYYISRRDDDMVCRIMKIEIDTSKDEGNILIITGYDAKQLLDQRILWGRATCKGNLELFIRKIVQNACCTGHAANDRVFKRSNGGDLIELGSLGNDGEGLKTRYSEQSSYKNLGEKIREYCKSNGWGYRLRYNQGQAVLFFELYRGKDRRRLIQFSPFLENLATSKYIHDTTGQGNVALVGGEGEGAQRYLQTFGVAAGINRYEQFVDAKDKTRILTVAELESIYPDGFWDRIEYVVRSIDIQVMDAAHRAWLQQNYRGGTFVTIDGTEYYRLTDLPVGFVDPGDVPNPSTPPAQDAKVALFDIIYNLYLLQRGEEKTATFGEKETFEGTIIPNVTFTYGKEYELGDFVTVKNEFGISRGARISEVLESFDASGYNIEPKFEYLGG